MLKRGQKMPKRLNVSISEAAHSIIEKYQFDNKLERKEDALDRLVKEFAKLKKTSF